MKISKLNNEPKQTGIKGWFDKMITGPFRWLFLAGFLGFALAAGFLYAWKFHPRSAIDLAVEPSPTPTQVPTPVPVSQEDIKPMPVIHLDVDSGSADSLRTDEFSATLTVNGKNKQTITLKEQNTGLQLDTSWQLNLVNENSDLLLPGLDFELIPALDEEPISVWLYGKQLQEAGMLIPDFIPALVSFDGKAESVYYLVVSEPGTGISFQLPEDFFTIKPYNIPDQETILNEVAASAKFYRPDLSEDELNGLLDYLTMLMRHPDEKMGAFSIELFSEFFAIHDVWAASYADLTITPVYLYNPQSKIIEPTIVNVNDMVLTGDGGENSFPFSSHPLFAFSEMQIAYAKALSQHADKQNVETLEQDQYAVFHTYEKQLKESTGKEYSTLWTFLRYRHKMMSLQLDPPYPVRGFVYAEAGSDCVNVSVLNLMVLPVEVDRISLFGRDIPLQVDWLQNPTDSAVLLATDDILQLRPYKNPDYLMDFCVPAALFEDILAEQEIDKPLDEVLGQENTWIIEAHISGLEKSYPAVMIPDIPPKSGGERDMPSVQSVKTLTETFPFIVSNTAEDEITFLKGSWPVESDIVIPSGLTVTFEPGCELYFSPQSVLLSFSAFQAIGTENQPVLFSASGTTWPGMILIDAQNESVLEHVIVEKTGGIERGGWILTGGITFYRSPVIVKYSTFRDSVVEDAINVIRTTFTFDHLTILRTPSDAFDSDFADGEIIDCHFEDVGGDAVDISGAYVHVLNTTMLNITDKGLSAGEDSHMTAENLTMENMGIGSAAKDLSTLVISDSTIQNARVAGLAAYIKKSVYGPSSIVAENVQILDTGTETLVQTGSSIIWNGKEQDTKDLNVKILYELGILGN